MDRLTRKLELARSRVPAPVVRNREGVSIGIIGYGSSDAAIVESLFQLENEYQLEAAYLRIRALPFAPEVGRFVEEYDRIYVIDQNRDGQMADLVMLEVPDRAGRIRKVRHYNGLPIDARFITDEIIKLEGAGKDRPR
jgi:2-oxoglutarate ferredoxin oxidoreductase subunit alpha